MPERNRKRAFFESELINKIRNRKPIVKGKQKAKSKRAKESQKQKDKKTEIEKPKAERQKHKNKNRKAETKGGRIQKGKPESLT